MKRETVLKILLVLTVGVMLFALPVNVFAASTANDDLFNSFMNDGENNDLYEDQGSLEDITGTTTPEQQPEPQPQPQPEPEKQPETQQNPNTDIPKAGLAEDTMMLVGIAVLGITAVYAYKKVNEYKNI